MDSVATQGKFARRSALLALFFVLLIAAELLLVFGKALDHDEHQFIASGVLLARRGLLPYRDYPYFHTPDLTFIYAGLFRLSDHLLLSARLFSGVCALLLSIVIFAIARRCFGGMSWAIRSLLSVGVVLLCIANPLFTQTSGRAWNHDLPVLLCVLAFLCACASHGKYARILSLLTGLLLGVAIGTRLTFAPTVLVFATLVIASSAKGQAIVDVARRDDGLRGATDLSRIKAWRLALFLFGLLLGLVPTLAMFLKAPQQFIFGNFQYPVLNTAFRMAGQHHHEFNTGVGSRLWYVLLHFVLMPGTLFLLALLLLSLWMARRSNNDAYRLQRTYLPLLLLFLLPGALAPTPAFAQYFYVLVPFVVLWIVYALAATARDQQHTGHLVLPGVIAIIAIIAGVPMYMPERHWTLKDSAPLEIHRAGTEIRQLAGNGKVLTLTPIYPLEGGCDIYEAYATGPFAARIAPMLNNEQLQQIRLYNPGQLLLHLRQHAPAAVLAGSEGETDQPLCVYAATQPWREMRIDDLRLWVHSRQASRIAVARHD
jgi:hypothetical protein